MAPQMQMQHKQHPQHPQHPQHLQQVWTSPGTGVVRQPAVTYAAPSYSARTSCPVSTMPTPASTGRTIYVQQAPNMQHGMPSASAPRYVQAAPQSQVAYYPGISSGAARIVQRPPAQRTSQVLPHNLAGPSFTQDAYEVKHRDDDPQLQNLKELRKNSGLKTVPVAAGLQQLKAAAVDGKLGREQFLQVYQELLEAHGIELPSMEVRNAVFDLFDRDGNHVVDMMEIICGISLLCAGKEDDKINAVFDVFDENGDGFISMDEMFKFLTSVFKVVLTPNVITVMNSMGVTVESAEDLASVTSLECFKTADLNHDGKLSVSEFKNWFYAPRNDPSFLFSPVRKLLQ